MSLSKQSRYFAVGNSVHAPCCTENGAASPLRKYCTKSLMAPRLRSAPVKIRPVGDHVRSRINRENTFGNSAFSSSIIVFAAAICAPSSGQTTLFASFKSANRQTEILPSPARRYASSKRALVSASCAGFGSKAETVMTVCADAGILPRNSAAGRANGGTPAQKKRSKILRKIAHRGKIPSSASAAERYVTPKSKAAISGKTASHRSSTVPRAL